MTLTIETITMICHEANRAYEQSIGNYSIPKWCEVSEYEKISTGITISKIIDGFNTNTEINSVYWCLVYSISKALANFAELESANVATTI